MQGRRERGSATVWTVAVMAVLFMLTVTVVLTGTARAARHRAQSAADLGALAAARLAFTGPGRGCAEATALAAANGARLLRCSSGVDGVVEVRVVVGFSLPIIGGREATARARAGPVHIADPGGEARRGGGRVRAEQGRDRITTSWTHFLDSLSKRSRAHVTFYLPHVHAVSRSPPKEGRVAALDEGKRRDDGAQPGHRGGDRSDRVRPRDARHGGPRSRQGESGHAVAGHLGPEGDHLRPGRSGLRRRAPHQRQAGREGGPARLLRLGPPHAPERPVHRQTRRTRQAAGREMG
ncbi:flp pilus-assembly TadE/G-like family protein [Planomonospora sp. ID82291]|nr:flp pilus-assembly TadE/G-like family protein [Planomonospora sp. ID82291]